jgi:hypothetical protein
MNSAIVEHGSTVHHEKQLLLLKTCDATVKIDGFH